jgi:DNA-binding transcriptional LysR family regulator
MNLEARHLRSFLAVAEHLNFTHAAAELGIPQPALSNQIKRLEQILGLELFRRTTRSVALTPDGVAVLPAARRAATALDALTSSAAASGRRLRLATEDFTPALLEIAAGTRPVFEFDYAVMEQPTAIEQLADGRLDALLGWDYPIAPADIPPAVRREVIASERLCAYLPHHHPAAGRSSVALSELRDSAWVVRPRGTGHYAALQASARRAGFEPLIRYSSVDSHTAMTLLAEGSAISYGSPMSRANLGFALVPFSDPFEHEVVLLTHQRQVDNQQRLALTDIVHRWRHTIVARRLGDPSTSEAVRAALGHPRVDGPACARTTSPVPVANPGPIGR